MHDRDEQQEITNALLARIAAQQEARTEAWANLFDTVSRAAIMGALLYVLWKGAVFLFPFVAALITKAG